MALKGRRFPGSSAPGDLSSLGVGGRPGDFCGGLCAGTKALKNNFLFDVVYLQNLIIPSPGGC